MSHHPGDPCSRHHHGELAAAANSLAAPHSLTQARQVKGAEMHIWEAPCTLPFFTWHLMQIAKKSSRGARAAWRVRVQVSTVRVGVRTVQGLGYSSGLRVRARVRVQVRVGTVRVRVSTVQFVQWGYSKDACIGAVGV